jgi:hypothetical protein
MQRYHSATRHRFSGRNKTSHDAVPSQHRPAFAPDDLACFIRSDRQQRQHFQNALLAQVHIAQQLLGKLRHVGLPAI